MSGSLQPDVGDHVFIGITGSVVGSRNVPVDIVGTRQRVGDLRAIGIRVPTDWRDGDVVNVSSTSSGLFVI